MPNQLNLLPLDALAVGQAGVLRRMDGHDSVRYRLMEMGLLPGSRIEVTKIAPMGDPINLKIRQHYLSLRKDEASRLMVTPE